MKDAQNHQLKAKKGHLVDVLTAAERMDWVKVVENGGPPCFQLCEDGHFCGRAERWAGHDDPKEFHEFISLAELLMEASVN